MALRKQALGILVVAVAALLAACGDDGGASASGGSESAIASGGSGSSTSVCDAFRSSLEQVAAASNAPPGEEFDEHNFRRNGEATFRCHFEGYNPNNLDRNWEARLQIVPGAHLCTPSRGHLDHRPMSGDELVSHFGHEESHPDLGFRGDDLDELVPELADAFGEDFQFCDQMDVIGLASISGWPSTVAVVILGADWMVASSIDMEPGAGGDFALTIQTLIDSADDVERIADELAAMTEAPGD